MQFITDKAFKEGPDWIRNVLDPFYEGNLTPAGVDLTIGNQCYNVTAGKRVDLSKGEVLTLQHGDFARVLTQERIRMPSSWFGMVFGKTSLAGKGLTHLGTKIDPGFDGQLMLTFQHLGNELLRFKQGDRICNVAFIDMEEDPLTIYTPRAMKIVEVPLRPDIVGLSMHTRKQSTEELRQFYSKELVEFYLSSAQWFQKQEKRIDKATHKIDEWSRNLVLGIIVAAIGSITVACGAVFTGIVQLALKP